MYDLLAISAGDIAAIVSAVAAVGVFLGSLLGGILHYVLRIENRLTALEGAVKALQDS